MNDLAMSSPVSFALLRLTTAPAPLPPPPILSPVPLPFGKLGYLRKEGRKSAGCPPFSGGTKARPVYQAPTKKMAARGRSLPGGGVWKYWWLSARFLVAKVGGMTGTLDRLASTSV